MSDKNANAVFYISAWREALRILLSWNESQIDAWIRRWDAYLTSGRGGFYHEGPMYYVSREIVDVVLPGLTGIQRSNIARAIQEQIENGDPNFERNEAFNWGAASDRVRVLLETYGVRLP